MIHSTRTKVYKYTVVKKKKNTKKTCKKQANTVLEKNTL